MMSEGEKLIQLRDKILLQAQQSNLLESDSTTLSSDQRKFKTKYKRFRLENDLIAQKQRSFAQDQETTDSDDQQDEKYRTELQEALNLDNVPPPPHPPLSQSLPYDGPSEVLSRSNLARPHHRTLPPLPLPPPPPSPPPPLSQSLPYDDPSEVTPQRLVVVREGSTSKSIATSQPHVSGKALGDIPGLHLIRKPPRSYAESSVDAVATQHQQTNELPRRRLRSYQETSVPVLKLDTAVDKLPLTRRVTMAHESPSGEASPGGLGSILPGKLDFPGTLPRKPISAIWNPSDSSPPVGGDVVTEGTQTQEDDVVQLTEDRNLSVSAKPSFQSDDLVEEGEPQSDDLVEIEPQNDELAEVETHPQNKGLTEVEMPVPADSRTNTSTERRHYASDSPSIQGFSQHATPTYLPRQIYAGSRYSSPRNPPGPYAQRYGYPERVMVSDEMPVVVSSPMSATQPQVPPLYNSYPPQSQPPRPRSVSGPSYPPYPGPRRQPYASYYGGAEYPTYPRYENPVYNDTHQYGGPSPPFSAEPQYANAPEYDAPPPRSQFPGESYVQEQRYPSYQPPSQQPWNGPPPGNRQGYYGPPSSFGDMY
jgi:hypothetical protein